MRQTNRIAHYTRVAAVGLSCSTLLAWAPIALAQHPGGGAAPTPVAPKEGTQFDFLVGQWELVVKPQATTLAQRIHGVGKLPGTWKAWRALDGWGIEDELRITDPSGNPRLLLHAVRFFDASNRHWSIAGVDVYRSLATTSTAEWKNGEMVSTGQGTETDERAYISRATFSSITPTSFAYRLDRSFDGGKSWTEGVTRIEAKRVSASAAR
ncbi:MAG: hypothetical protein ABIT38_05400 [Gemmatimonadaceae bacterium]